MRTLNPLPSNSALRMGLAAALLILAAGIVAHGTPAEAIEVLHHGSKSLSLELSQGQLVRLDRPAATVFIADPSIADVQVKSPSIVYVTGKRTGQTTLFAVDAKDRVLANVNVEVTFNLSRLREAINTLHPGLDIQVASAADAILLKGQVDSAKTAEDIHRLAKRYAGQNGEVIDRIAINAPSQVNLRVRVVEVTRQVKKQFGINWDAAASVGGMAFGLITYNPYSNFIAQNIHSASVGYTHGSTDINSVIDAMEEEGMITVLAEPNLTAMSGETASFLAGGEFPYLVPRREDQVTVLFKKFGVALAFTPTIVDSSRINIHVAPEVSELSDENGIDLFNFRMPGLTTRRAETTVELGSGQSFAIAGLLQNNINHAVNEFPGLGDIPVLGGLFRSDRFRRDESELVIIVTPYIVKPTSDRAKLMTPTDGFAPQHDVERFITGGTSRRNPVVGRPHKAAPGSHLAGPVGFQLD